MVEQLIRVAHRCGTDKLSTLKPALDAELDSSSVFKASLQQDDEFLKKLAASLDIDPEAFQAVMTLLPVPLLQACNRRWAQTIAARWVEPYCPICGAWPAFAETRGIERGRYLRCGRCGAEWQTHVLSCPYCGNTDHQELASLVAENSAKSAIDACKRCLGYIRFLQRSREAYPTKWFLKISGASKWTWRPPIKDIGAQKELAIESLRL